MVQQLCKTLKAFLVEDLPEEQTACLHCNKGSCTKENYKTCPNRLSQLKPLPKGESNV